MLDNFITKAMSGHFKIDLLHPEGGGLNTAISLYIKYTQWYDVLLNSSKLSIDSVYLSDTGGRDSGIGYLDGIIKIGTDIAYAAKLKDKNTFVNYNEEPSFYEEIFSGKQNAFRKVYTTKEKDSAGNPIPLTFSVEIKHEISNTENTASIDVAKILFSGNTRSKFSVYHERLERYYDMDMITREIYQENDYKIVPLSVKEIVLPLYRYNIHNIISTSSTIIGDKCSVQFSTDSMYSFPVDTTYFMEFYDSEKNIMYSGNYYYELILSCGDWKQVIDLDNNDDTVLSKTGSPVKYEGVIPLDVLYSMPNTSRSKVKVVLNTYIDREHTNLVGSSSSIYFNISIPSNAIPVVKSARYSIKYTEDRFSALRTLITNYSSIYIVASANGFYGSTIDRYEITGAYNATIIGETLEYNGDIIKSSGFKSITIYAIDSRGMRSFPYMMSGSNMIAYPYDIPVINLFNVARTESDEGVINFDAQWHISPVDSYNKSSVTIQYKKKYETIWKHLYSMYNSTTSFIKKTITNPDSVDGKWDTESSYEFLLTVSDSANSKATSTRDVFTTTAILDFKEPGSEGGTGGIAVGKICELDNTFEVWLDTRFYNGVYVGDKTLSEYILDTSRIVVKNIEVKPSDYILEQEPDDLLYPYKVDIPIADVTENMLPNVQFSLYDIQNRNFAAYVVSYNGGIYLFANSIPSGSTTIPYITIAR